MAEIRIMLDENTKINASPLASTKINALPRKAKYQTKLMNSTDARVGSGSSPVEGSQAHKLCSPHYWVFVVEFYLLDEKMVHPTSF